MRTENPSRLSFCELGQTRLAQALLLALHRHLVDHALRVLAVDVDGVRVPPQFEGHCSLGSLHVERLVVAGMLPVGVERDRYQT